MGGEFLKLGVGRGAVAPRPAVGARQHFAINVEAARKSKQRVKIDVAEQPRKCDGSPFRVRSRSASRLWRGSIGPIALSIIEEPARRNLRAAEFLTSNLLPARAPALVVTNLLSRLKSDHAAAKLERHAGPNPATLPATTKSKRLNARRA